MHVCASMHAGVEVKGAAAVDHQAKMVQIHWNLTISLIRLPGSFLADDPAQITRFSESLIPWSRYFL